MSSSDRLPHETATSLTQTVLDYSHDNLTNQLEMICEIEAPDASTIRVSDRNKYVGEHFYEARMQFPDISRTLGDWLSDVLEFSDIQFRINNADGFFDQFLQSGASYQLWVGNQVEIKLGLRDVESTYFTIFRGKVTEQNGFKRDVDSIILTARDEFDSLNTTIPNNAYGKVEFPDIEDIYVGRQKGLIYGHWIPAEDPEVRARIPVIPTNGNAAVNAPFPNVECQISENANQFINKTSLIYVRDGVTNSIASIDVTNINVDNNKFEIIQSGTSSYLYQPGDQLFIGVRGKNVGTGLRENIVAQARDLLETYGGLTAGNFDANWDTFRDKNSPAESDITSVKARAYILEPVNLVEYVTKMLEQVRLEMFVERTDLKLKINSLHFDDFDPDPSYLVRNFDIERGTFEPQLDFRNNFNRSRGLYNLVPEFNDFLQNTDFFKNDAAITAAGKSITKTLTYPNLYIESDVDTQMQETLKLASSYFDIIECNMTWRALLQDLSGFVKMNISLGSTKLSNVPAMIREIGYDPVGLRLKMKIWSFETTPFPGYTPSGSGIIGGSTATITKE